MLISQLVHLLVNAFGSILYYLATLFIQAHKEKESRKEVGNEEI